MADAIPIASACKIRECGFDEYWLQGQIADNPDCLQLGDLELVYREKKQTGGGRLDLLLTDPRNDSMYEVEVMLGETDESHIIRTIEYWDREKRKWPQRRHTAVLVAELINRRFFNVVHLLSQCIPIVAVQVNIVEADGKRVLHFSKILDTYEEPELGPGPVVGPTHDKEYWQTYSPWTLETANALLGVVRPVCETAVLTFLKRAVAIRVGGNNHMYLDKRASPKSRLAFKVSEAAFPAAAKLFGDANLEYDQDRQFVLLTVHKHMIESNSELFKEIAELVKQYWEN